MRDTKFGALINLIRDPDMAAELDMVQWDLIVRQARSSRMLAGLLNYLSDRDVIPAKARKHMESVEKQANRTIISTKWEVSLVEKLAKQVDYPVVVLKGGAYVLRGYKCSRGRIFSDLDLLVPEKNIYDFERLLKNNGWKGEKLHPYDQKYYRLWMHELPPLTNTQTGASLDLHHNILPKTSHIKVDANRFLENIVPLKSYENLYTFSPEDMVLHSLTHLFHEGEFEHGLRDLVDLDLMLRQFAREDADFFERLESRAITLNLQQPLYYALKYVTHFLLTPVPAEILERCEQGRPLFPGLMDFFFIRALRPAHISCDDKLTAFARWGLYVRSHFLRMPLYLLIPHLLRKAYMARMEKEQTVEV